MRKLGGHTLLDWSVSAYHKSQLIEKIYVSTDATHYAEHAKELGANVPFL